MLLFLFSRLPLCLYDPATWRGWISNFRMHIVFMVWNLFGGILVYFFLAKFLEVLLIRQTEEPVDTPQQILDRGLVPFVMDAGYYYKEILEESPLPALQEVGSKTLVPDTYDQYLLLCKEGLHGARTHVLFGNIFVGDEDAQYGKHYWSKDTVPGTIPYGGAIMNKKWPYAEQYHRYLLIVIQVMKPSAIRVVMIML